LPRKEDKQNIEKGLIAITNTSHEFETEIRVKKSVRDLSESLTLRFIAWWNNEAPGYKGILQDITKDKKVMKELLKAKEKAERSDRLKSHFLTNLSYEIRTPMNAILGFAELLNLEDLTIEQKLDYTRIIRQKGNTLLTMIDDGIELSKFETGNIPINKTEFEIYPLLKELYSDCEQKRIELAKNNIKVELVDPEEIKNEKIFTDSGRLQQMLSNLLSNALKFTEKGEIEFGYKKSGKFHKFYVKDTGIGIPKEDQNIIFNRFQEIEETSSKRYTGGGMNLTISKHIVELLGGKIKVKSEVNKGSRFQISIPVESSKNKISDMTEFDDTKTVNWKDRVILIAEDEDINFRFLEAILQKTQAQILRAGTGKESVELCRNIQKIDLVLMDIKMPDINGLEATKEIKSLRPSLPVIAQTAFATQEELNKCQESGCDDIITKPIDIKLLIRKINDLLQ
jgi:signal transduction histidine kinase/CheY-like chemotaxis protein